jgi:DNA-binding beta-propeller fold protein YncE
MKRAPVGLVALAVVAFTLALCDRTLLSQSRPAAAPSFQVDPSWPKELPNNWLVGNVVGVAVDSRDNVWIIHRPNSQAGAEKTPPVIAFDQAGNVVHSWGGPGAGYDWGTQAHGMYVDYKDNVWVGFGGGLPYDIKSKATTDNAVILKFTPQGKFQLQLGKFGQGTDGSNSTTSLGQPTDIAVDPKTDEVYITDGYTNRRVIVFDANTGAYKRHWGAFGKRPDDAPLPAFSRTGTPRQQFDTPHCVALANDGLVYVCDRGNQRIQVFRKDGTFVKDMLINAKLADGSTGGTPWDIAFSTDPQQSLIFLADGGNHRVHTLRRESLEVASTFGRRGRWVGQFESPHSIAIDSKGNLFVAETLDGRRVQKFTPRAAASSR